MEKIVYTALCGLIPFLYAHFMRVLYAMAYTTLCYMFLILFLPGSVHDGIIRKMKERRNHEELCKAV